MGLRYGRGDVAPARRPHPLPTSPKEQSSEDRISGREKLDTSVGGLECGSLPGACCGFGGTVPGPTHRLPWSRGLTQASREPGLWGLGWMDNRTQVKAGLEVEGEMRSPSQLHHLLSARRQEGIWAKEMHLGFRRGWVRGLCCCKFTSPSFLTYRMGTTTPILRVALKIHGEHPALCLARSSPPQFYFPSSLCPGTSPSHFLWPEL